MLWLGHILMISVPGHLTGVSPIFCLFVFLLTAAFIYLFFHGIQLSSQFIFILLKLVNKILLITCLSQKKLWLRYAFYFIFLQLFSIVKIADDEWIKPSHFYVFFKCIPNRQSVVANNYSCNFCLWFQLYTFSSHVWQLFHLFFFLLLFSLTTG
jgi:hypothetical protein